MRPQLFAGISGIILDAGVGTGRNLPFYPEGPRVIGIDSSPGMIARILEHACPRRGPNNARAMSVARTHRRCYSPANPPPARSIQSPGTQLGGWS